MGRAYHVVPRITIEDIIKNTSINVLENEDEGYVSYLLQDSLNNKCWVNMSEVYLKEDQMASVLVGVLDFYGNNEEWHILSELFEKTGVLFYDDSMISVCIYERRSLKKGEVVEFTRNVLGQGIIDFDFIPIEDVPPGSDAAYKLKYTLEDSKWVVL